MKPPFLKDIYFEQNCFIVVLDGTENSAPAVENGLGDFVVLTSYKNLKSHYMLDFTDVEHSRTLQYGQWTLIDSQTYIALRYTEDLARSLSKKKKIFKVSSQHATFDATCHIKDKFGTKRIVLSFDKATKKAETLGEKIPTPTSAFFIKLGILLLSCVYAIMKLFPQQNKYTFISKLSKKPPMDIRLLSDYVSTNQKEIKVAVLAQPMHPYLHYLPHMFRQMWHLATSKVVFLDRSCLVVHALKHKKDLRIVQLWHALGPMKTFGCANIDAQEGQPHQLADLFHMHRGYTDILISSKSFERDFIEGFGLTKKEAREKLHEIPLPRCDFFLDEKSVQEVRNKLINKYPKLAEKKNVLYAPTYRMGNRSIKRAYEGYKSLLDAIDGERYNVIYSPHPLSKAEVKDDKVVPVESVTQECLCVADIVISDFSTIIYEAGLVGLPIYLYCFDYEQYLADRELNIDVKKDIPLPFCETAEQLVNSIDNNEYNNTQFQAFMNDVVRLPKDKSCCQAICELVAD